MRDRLIELIEEAAQMWDENPLGSFDEVCADHLLANGVIVPPVNVGQTVWVCNTRTGCVYRNAVVSIKTSGTGRHKNTITVEYHNKCGESSFRKFEWAQIGKSVFRSREAAEKALEGGAE